MSQSVALSRVIVSGLTVAEYEPAGDPEMIKTTSRQSLAGLPLAKKSAPAATHSAEHPAAPDKRSAREARVSSIVRLTAAERKSLRMIALQQDSTVQAIVGKAVRDVIARDGK